MTSFNSAFQGVMNMGLFDYFFKPKSESSFAEQLIQGLKNAGEQKQIEYLPDSFQLQFLEDDTEVGIVNLANLFAEYSQLEQHEVDTFFQKSIRALLSYQKQIPEEFEDAKYDIRPVVRSKSYFEMIMLEQKLQGDIDLKLPYVEIGQNLLVAPVFDLPESIQTIDSDTLAKWNLSLYEVMEIAQANLAEVDSEVALLEDQVYLFTTGDSYDASRLLLIDRIDELKIEGKPIAMIPNRDLLIVTGSESEHGLELMVKIAQSAIDQPRPVSGVALCLENGYWENWLPEMDHELYPHFFALAQSSLFSEYHEQKQMLTQLLAQMEQKAKVADFQLTTAEHLTQQSYCECYGKQTFYLPKTEYVVIRSSASEDATIIAATTWQAWQQLCDAGLIDQETYPPLYKLEQKPDPSDIKSLGIDPQFLERMDHEPPVEED